MNQKIINLFDEYTHAPLTREVFMKRLAKLTGGMAAAMATLPLLEVNYAHAATVTPHDQDIVVSEVTYPGDGTEVKAYLAKPAAPKATGAVVVIHENRGLNPHTKDVARRVAKAGFIGMAVDALSPFGGTPANEDEARELIGKLDVVQNRNNFLKGIEYLRSVPGSNGKTASVGFCWGGAMSGQLAVYDGALNGAVCYYGRQVAADDVPKIEARLQLHYGGLDERVNAGIPTFEKALKEAGKEYELYVYEGAQHAFLNDTAPTRYSPEAAKLAWDRTLRFFQETIG